MGQRNISVKHRYSVLWVGLLVGTIVWCGQPLPAIALQADSSVQSFQFPDRGGVSFRSAGDGSGSPFVAYGTVESTGGSSVPPGFAILVRRDDEGTVTTETTVPAVSLIQEGRTYASYTENIVDTAIAIVNPNDEEVTISFFFTDPATNPEELDFGHEMTIGPNQQISTFLSQDPFNLETGTHGTFSFSSSLPVAAIALTQVINDRGDALYNTLPVVDLNGTHTTDTTFIPHLATGGTWTTDFILINPTNELIAGRLIFVSLGTLQPAGGCRPLPCNQPGVATKVSVNNGNHHAHDYVVGAKGMSFYRTTPFLAYVQTFTARATPVAQGGAAPVVQVVLSSRRFVEQENGAIGSDLVTQAGFASSQPDTAFRAYVELQGEPGLPGSINSGLALNNIDLGKTVFGPLEPATIAAELTDLDGNLQATAEVRVPASGQRSLFVNEIFPDFDFGGSFKGVVRVSTVDQQFAIVGLRARWNARSEFLITTTPPIAEAVTPGTSKVFFPHLVEGGGWTSEIILFSGTAGQAAAGQIDFTGTDGEPVEIPLQ
jgi:hypothetical protein